ncbi:TetR family transcriptional regulator [Seongchinamella sediminis]|uniref:TetR family transcriptional regulator n=1 Tax=Seongchinamella sediminis TaxID=2283635 RepID=A0A3L7DW53_9GAMM|nr:TetR/AcrR family transcriptional regulator [Seongchinamella sediminis]RLQ21544.1 TetR family transcriptional regulator [Seongchinamella sediminis]
MQQPRFSSTDCDDPMVERILDAAEQCIHRFGIRRTSMGEVARVGGLSRGSIYRYFGDKQTLVQGALARRQELFLNHTEAVLETLPTLVDKVTHAVVAGRRDSEEGIFASLAQTEPETVAAMYLDPAFYQRSVAFWPPHIRQAQAAGEISAAIDVAAATDFVMRLAVSMTLFPNMGLSLKSSSRIRAYLEQTLLSGLGEGR